LTKIQFPISLVVLADFCFAFCSSLNHVFFIPGENEQWQLETIGTGALFDCPFARQGSLRIPETVRTIGAFAFQSRVLGREPLQFVLPPTSNVQSLSSKCFANRPLQRLDLPRYVEILSDSSFAGCLELREVSLNMSLRRLERGCFQGCSLVGVAIPRTVTIIGESCFSECQRLASVDFEAPSDLTTIGALEFHKTSIQSIIIPTNVIVIGQGAFSDCSQLRTLKFSAESMLVSIGSGAFFGTVKLCEKVVLPSRVSFIGESCFSGSSIPEFEFSAECSMAKFGFSPFAG
jgi:hypothetical protein